MNIEWQKFEFENLNEALSKNHCLYVFHHKDDGDRPFYIGKAKYFGPSQESGYRGSARYNAGYHHLLFGLIRSGFTLYIAEIGESEFEHAEKYEQQLILDWDPVRKQKVKPDRLNVNTTKPWC